MVEIIVAIVAGAFLIGNTVATSKVNKKLKTQNGMDVGEYTERTWYKLGALEGKIDAHITNSDIHFRDS